MITLKDSGLKEQTHVKNTTHWQIGLKNETKNGIQLSTVYKRLTLELKSCVG